MTTQKIRSWNIEQTWGSDRFYYEGDVAEGMYAFVVDSGVAPLDDLNVVEEWSKNFVDDTSPLVDELGHGTAVASIIGAKANYEGLTGVAPGAQIVSVKVFSRSPKATGTDIEDGIAYAGQVILENDLVDKAVINLSLGRWQPNRYEIVKELADQGVKFAVAAGNQATDVDQISPASWGHHPNVWTVSGTDQENNYPWWTNFDGPDLDNQDDVQFSAPGRRPLTYKTDGRIETNRGGTSFSAPHVAGILLMSDQIRPGVAGIRSQDQIDMGMIPDPRAMFDPYTYKHGPSTGEPAPPAPEETIIPKVVTPVIPTDERIRLRGTHFEDELIGGDNRDKLRGLRGDDIITGFEGDDFIRGGKGDDIIDGGVGADIMFGGLGSNTFKDQRDGERDMAFVGADTDVDIFEGLDDNDTIFVKDVWDVYISVDAVEEDIGIFAKGELRALYTGRDLSVSQLEDMTYGY